MKIFFIRHHLEDDSRPGVSVVERSRESDSYELRFNGNCHNIAPLEIIQSDLRCNGYPDDIHGPAWYSVDRHPSLI